MRFPLDGPHGGEPARLLGGRCQVVDFAAAGGVVAAVADATSAGELVVLQDGTERVVSDFGALLARSAPLRPLEELEATAPDATRSTGGWSSRPARRARRGKPDGA